MTRLSFIIALTLMLGLGLLGGILATGHLLSGQQVPGSVRLGPWVAWPKGGAQDADPYSRAVFARRGDIPMAPVEGLALFANKDDSGAGLTGRCEYEVAGTFPQARAWTLSVYAPDGRLLPGPSGRSSMTSADALVEGAKVTIILSAAPRTGNWLPIGAGDAFVVALRFYETPLSAVSAGLDRARLPMLRRVGCLS